MLPITPIVKHLLIINVIFFFAIQIMPDQLKVMMPFNSPGTEYYLQEDLVIKFQPFQIITHMFSHFELDHLFFNMLSLFFLGPMVEYYLGPKKFLGLYLISGLSGLAAHLLVHYLPYLTGQTYMLPLFSVLGASGAVFGVTIAFATLFPQRQLMLLFPPIPIKAWLLAVILVGMGLYLGISGRGGNIAHFAHLGGALAGFILARHWKRGGQFLK